MKEYLVVLNIVFIFVEIVLNMTRKEFSDKLSKCREEANCGKNELCRRTGLTFQQLQRLENASNNFLIDNAIQYLKEIGYGIYISQKKDKSLLFDSRESFAKHFTLYWSRTKMTLKEFSEYSGIGWGTITGIKYNSYNTSIDVLLLCLEKLDCNIEIKKL